MGTIVRDMGTTGRRRTTDAEPATILFGNTRRRVLGWLLGHADETFYLRQIVRQTGSSQGGVQRELEALTRAGLLRRTVQGRQVYFQANRESPIFPELETLFLKTAGVADVLREALAALGDRVIVAFVFGSAARGALRPASDVDLLVVGDLPFEAVVNALGEAQRRLGREVNPTVYPPDEFRTKIRAKHHFLTTVLHEPRVFVIGGPSELVGLGVKRLADSAQNKPKRDLRPARYRRARPRRQRR